MGRNIYDHTYQNRILRTMSGTNAPEQALEKPRNRALEELRALWDSVRKKKPGVSSASTELEPETASQKNGLQQSSVSGKD